MFREKLSSTKPINPKLASVAPNVSDEAGHYRCWERNQKSCKPQNHKTNAATAHPKASVQISPPPQSWQGNKDRFPGCFGNCLSLFLHLRHHEATWIGSLILNNVNAGHTMESSNAKANRILLNKSGRTCRNKTMSMLGHKTKGESKIAIGWGECKELGDRGFGDRAVMWDVVCGDSENDG